MTTLKPQYAMATTEEGLVPDGYLFMLKVTTPRSDPYIPASKVYELANGGVRTAGVGLAAWSWAFISLTERNILRALCPGAFAEIYIRTLDENNAWANMRGKMFWPTKGEVYNNDQSINLTIGFKIFEVFEEGGS